MAATGFTPIKLYASSTASAVPLAANLDNTNGAELAINTADGRLFYKDSSGVVQTMASKATGAIGGSTTQVQFNSSGALAGSANLTFNGTTLTSAGFAGPGTGLTGTASGLSIGGNAATATSATSATSATAATTATNVAGGAANQLPYQTGAGATSFITAPTVASTSLTWNGSAFTWATAGSTVTVTNDTSTASNLYPLFATATSGTVSAVNTSNAKLLYKPSTGDLQASQVVASNGIVVNSNTVAASYSIPSGSSAMSVGPMTVASGQSVTIPTGSRWLIL
jgi:hypothetical protein